jgi:hypothetical protein
VETAIRDDGSAAGAGGTATGAAGAGAEIHFGRDLETEIGEIHFYGLDLLVKFLIDNEFEAIDFRDFVGFPRLIQSHRQRGTASPAFVKEDPYGGNLFAFEIFGNLLGGFGSYFDHKRLLKGER